MLKRSITLLQRAVVSGERQRTTVDDFSVVTDIDNLVQQSIELQPDQYNQFCTSKFIQIRSAKPVNFIMDNYTIKTRYFSSILSTQTAFTIHNDSKEPIVVDILRG